MQTDLEGLGRAIKQAQYRHHRALDAALATVGTTLAQWDALRAISRSPGASGHALAQETFQTDQAFGTLANRLVGQGLVERRPGFGRRIEHHLTTAGQQLLQSGYTVHRGVLEASFADLSEEERRVLLELLPRITGGTKPAAPG